MTEEQRAMDKKNLELYIKHRGDTIDGMVEYVNMVRESIIIQKDQELYKVLGYICLQSGGKIVIKKESVKKLPTRFGIESSMDGDNLVFKMITSRKFKSLMDAKLKKAKKLNKLK